MQTKFLSCSGSMVADFCKLYQGLHEQQQALADHILLLRQGHRSQLASYMRKGVQKYGFACISADYRLAPQVSVKDILQDVKDCIAFIRNDLSSHVDHGAVDVSRIAVSGSSAGGYLALLAGLYVDPKPNVILPIYPITDPLGTFFTNPQPPPMGRHVASKEEMAPFLDPKAEAVANCTPNPEEDARMHMYVRMLRSANLAELLGVSEAEEAAPFRISRCVYEHRLPPAYFLHGDADGAVGEYIPFNNLLRLATILWP